MMPPAPVMVAPAPITAPLALQFEKHMTSPPTPPRPVFPPAPLLMSGAPIVLPGCVLLLQAKVSPATATSTLHRISAISLTSLSNFTLDATRTARPKSLAACSSPAPGPTVTSILHVVALSILRAHTDRKE